MYANGEKSTLYKGSSGCGGAPADVCAGSSFSSGSSGSGRTDEMFMLIVAKLPTKENKECGGEELSGGAVKVTSLNPPELLFKSL